MPIKDNRLIDWAIQQTRTHYAGEIALLLEHNSYALPEDRGLRYVNTIISDAQPLVGLARTFIIGGIGYDFWQRSWESFERDAEARSYFLNVLAEADILYARNEADRQRFLYLRAKLFSNLADFSYMYQRGLEWLQNAMELYKVMAFETGLCQMRKAAGTIAEYLSVAVACLNQTYFHGIDHIAELRQMKAVPEKLLAGWDEVMAASTGQALQEISHRMIREVRAFFEERDPRPKPVPAPDYPFLASWYQECSYYFRRLYAYCRAGDFRLAFQQGIVLQPDLDDLARDFAIPGLDILTWFDPAGLDVFEQKARQAEQNIVQAILAAGVSIDASDTVEEFLAKNP